MARIVKLAEELEVKSRSVCKSGGKLLAFV